MDASVRYPLLSCICVVGFSLVSSFSFAADASFSFAPAPANLSGDINKNKIGLDVVTVQIDGASDLTATTFRYLSKTGRELPDSDKKRVAALNYYLTSIDSPDFDSAMAFGFGFDGISGSPTGSAIIFGMGMDMQSFSSETATSSLELLSLVTHLDIGLQNHYRVGENSTFVPWAKASYFYTSTSVTVGYDVPYVFGGGTYRSYSYDTITSSFASLSYGMDFLYRGYSLGAMYQQGDNSSITKFSVSMDF